MFIYPTISQLYLTIPACWQSSIKGVMIELFQSLLARKSWSYNFFLPQYILCNKVKKSSIPVLLSLSLNPYFTLCHHSCAVSGSSVALLTSWSHKTGSSGAIAFSFHHSNSRETGAWACMHRFLFSTRLATGGIWMRGGAHSIGRDCKNSRQTAKILSW